MSAIAVSVLVLAGCGVIIVGGALLGIYVAERRRARLEKSPAAPVSGGEVAPRKSRS